MSNLKSETLIPKENRPGKNIPHRALFALFADDNHSSLWLSRASTLKSSSVVVSPLISVPEAICLSKRRMIFPERVFGNVSAKRISSGLATGPISLATCWRSSSRMAWSGFTPPLSVTNATSA